MAPWWGASCGIDGGTASPPGAALHKGPSPVAPQPLWLLAARVSRTPQLQNSEEVEMDAMAHALKDTVKEVLANHRAQLQREDLWGSGQHHEEGSTDTGADSSTASKPNAPTTIVYVVPRDRAAAEDDSGGPNNSPWGRRALGDDWYDERCIKCSVCHRPVSASVRHKRGLRCGGCLRWFHDSCAPAGTLPANKAQRECDPTISGWTHCTTCAQLQQRLSDGAAAVCAKQLAGGCTLSLVDLHRLRQHLQPGPYTTGNDGEGVKGKKQAGRQSARSTQPFQRIARSDLRVMQRSGQAYAGISGGEASVNEAAGPWGAEQANSGKAVTPVHVRLQGPRAGLSDLAAVTRIFKTYDKETTQEDLMQDSWAALLRCDGTPVSGATLVVLGDDHARVQGLVTMSDLRRKGHARVLLSEVSEWLSAAGVPRLVAVLPEQRPGRQEDDGERTLRRLQFKPLQDLDTLGKWKETYPSHYSRDLIGRGPRVLLKDTAKRSGWGWW